MLRWLTYLCAAVMFVGGFMLLRAWDIQLPRDLGFTVPATVLAGGLLSFLVYRTSEDWRPTVALGMGFLLVLIPAVTSRLLEGWIAGGLALLGSILIVVGIGWGWLRAWRLWKIALTKHSESA